MRPSQILATVSRQTLFPLLEKEGGGDVRVNLASETHNLMYCTQWNPMLYM